MQVFSCDINPSAAVNAIKQYGVAFFACTTTPFEALSARIMSCIEPNTEIAALPGFSKTPVRGYLYYIYDSNRLDYGSKELQDLIEEADQG